MKIPILTYRSMRIDGNDYARRAAFASDPSPVTEGSDRWRLGRYVFGRDWKTPEELVRVLQG